MNRCVGLLLILTLLLAGCGKEKEAPTAEPLPLDDNASFAALNRGARLYQEHCAQCHGPEGEGHPDWQTPGVVAAPPLNGTGNDWKRSQAQWVAVIKEGAKRDGEFIMPAWKGRLTDAEINEMISWLQALWPPEVYAKWRRANPQASAR